jgi:hypothetical protein
MPPRSRGGQVVLAILQPSHPYPPPRGRDRPASTGPAAEPRDSHPWHMPPPAAPNPARFESFAHRWQRCLLWNGDFGTSPLWRQLQKNHPVCVRGGVIAKAQRRRSGYIAPCQMSWTGGRFRLAFSAPPGIARRQKMYRRRVTLLEAAVSDLGSFSTNFRFRDISYATVATEIADIEVEHFALPRYLRHQPAPASPMISRLMRQVSSASEQRIFFRRNKEFWLRSREFTWKLSGHCSARAHAGACGRSTNRA